MISNYERYFGDAVKAAESISRIIDCYEWLRENGYECEDYRSEFTDHFRLGGDCEYGLIHSDSLADWLEAPWDGFVLTKVTNNQEYPLESTETLTGGDKKIFDQECNKDYLRSRNAFNPFEGNNKERFKNDCPD